MKKLAVFLVLILCAGMTFAQKASGDGESNGNDETAATSKERKNSLALDAFPLFKGFIATDTSAGNEVSYFNVALGFERLVAPHWSFGVDLDMYFGKLGKADTFYFALSAQGRYYPVSENFEKFFMGAGLGYNTQRIDGDEDFSGLTIALKSGYKLITPKNIYLEPSMSYILSKIGMMSFFGSGVTPLGWQGGLRIGLVF
jgi:hypothetical protein